MVREYVTFVGLLSHTPKGLSILQDMGAFEIFASLIPRNLDHVLRLLIFSLDYSQDTVTRQFLKQCLNEGSTILVQCGVQLIHLLFKNELVDFNDWVIDILIELLDRQQNI